MKLIGRRSSTTFLVEVAQVDRVRMARVLDLDQRRLFPPRALESIVIRGYWEDYEDAPGELERLLTKVQVVDE